MSSSITEVHEGVQELIIWQVQALAVLTSAENLNHAVESQDPALQVHPWNDLWKDCAALLTHKHPGPTFIGTVTNHYTKQKSPLPLDLSKDVT